MASPLRNPELLHGTQSDTGMLLTLTVDGHSLRVVDRGIRWLLTNEIGHGGVSGEAWIVTLEDGSTWWAVRDLMSGRKWIGERVS
jgi:hypothetical protein